MGMPVINISFKQLASTVAQRSKRGIVSIILKDSTNTGFTEVFEKTDIPSGLNAENKKLLEMALVGNVSTPHKLLVYVMGTLEKLEDVLGFFETQEFNYIVMPSAIEDDKTAIKNWVIKMRDVDKIKVKTILGKVAGDHEGIINFATDDCEIDGTKYSADKMVTRIGGLIAGTPLNQSITYVKLKDVTSVPSMTKDEANASVDAGKLILVRESGAIRVGRGVNSFTTFETPSKGELFSKIKIIDTIDLIHSDCKKVIVDEYIGKVANSYDNKCLLIVAIQEYLQELVAEQLIEKDFTVAIDIEAQKAYLKKIGVDINKMKEQEIKEANTRSNVFLKARVKVLDAVEDVALNFEF